MEQVSQESPQLKGENVLPVQVLGTTQAVELIRKLRVSMAS